MRNLTSNNYLSNEIIKKSILKTSTYYCIYLNNNIKFESNKYGKFIKNLHLIQLL